MKRLNIEYSRTDERGTLIQVSTGDWKQLNHLILKKGKMFGGHYRKLKKELFYCLGGKVLMDVEREGTIYHFELITGDSFLIEPLDKHTIKAQEDSELMELLSHEYSSEDIYE